MVVKTFMDMDQDSEEEKELYLNLALHLASDFFLKHPDKDVRLLVACCLADIFRIYAPEAPYTSPDKLKVPFIKSKSMIKQVICYFGLNFWSQISQSCNKMLMCSVFHHLFLWLLFSVSLSLVSRTFSCSSQDSSKDWRTQKVPSSTDTSIFLRYVRLVSRCHLDLLSGLVINN